MQELKGKVAVVTGGVSGIGLGIARALAAEGCHVAVADVEHAKAEEVAKEIVQRGVRSLAVACDVTERAQIEALADRAFAELGPVDVLVNNAGVGAVGPVADAPVRDLEWIFSVNVFGVWHGCSVFVPRMRAGGRPGHILNTGSEHVGNGVVRTPGGHFDAVQIFPPPFIRSASEVTSIRHGASFRTPKVGSRLPPGQNAIGS